LRPFLDIALALALLAGVGGAVWAWRRRQRTAWAALAARLGLVHRGGRGFSIGSLDGVRDGVRVRVEVVVGIVDLGRHDRTICTLATDRLPRELRLYRRRDAATPFVLEGAGRIAGAHVARALELCRDPVLVDTTRCELRDGELIIESPGSSAAHAGAIVARAGAVLAALLGAEEATAMSLVPETLSPGATYRVIQGFRTAEHALAREQLLRFEERIYNREDGSWLYRFSRAGGGDVWLVEADPVAIEVLRELARYLAPTSAS